jgi:hypothetical protein
MIHKIAGVENRGTRDCPFGFIYIARGKELDGRIGFGAHRENRDPLAVWACRETPDNLHPLTIEAAREALRSAFPHLVKPEAKEG